MAWAFWRGEEKATRPRVRKSADDSDAAAALRVHARRRLIGAAALLLAVAIVVPLLLDPAPRPVADNIAIDIPSEKQPFTPRLALPPVPDPAQTAPDAGAGDADGKAETAVEQAAEKAAPDMSAKDAKSAEKPRNGKHVLQAAALSTEAAARDLSDKLRKAGFAPFTEKVETKDGVRYRVRVGPYSSRDEAQRAQARLRALGVSATLVTAG
jgi:DedD protein